MTTNDRWSLLYGPFYFSFFVFVAVLDLQKTDAWSSSSSIARKQFRRYADDDRSRILLHNIPTTRSVDSTTTKSTTITVEQQQPRFHPTFQDRPVDVEEALSTSGVPSVEAERALSSLAATLLALLIGDEEAAESLSKDRHHKQSLIRDAFRAYDVCDSGTLSQQEARQLFVDLARNIVTDLATPSDDREMVMSKTTSKTNDKSKPQTSTQTKDNGDIDQNVVGLKSFRPTSNRTVVPKAARAHAQRVLAADEAVASTGSGANQNTNDSPTTTSDSSSSNRNRNSNTIERIASKLLLMADTDMDGRVSLVELAELFETIYGATTKKSQKDSSTGEGSENGGVKTFPQPLMALAGSLQLVPFGEGRREVTDAALPPDAEWNIGVPGDDHTLRRVVLDDGKLSVVGIGRSADASSYFLPELGIVFDAGLNVKSLRPRTVLLTHGHRDHISALPVHAASKAQIFCPQPIRSLVERFLLAEAQLNYGDATQTDDETIAALGEYDIRGVTDGDLIMLEKDAYQGSPTPIGVQVFRAPHKEGVPAVSYGLFRVKNRLKPEYSKLPKSEIGKLIRQDKDVQLTEAYHDGVLFYTGDTTINLLKDRWEEILTKYRHIIHEVTFLGRPSSDLDATTAAKGHTHYAQLHPWICAFPDTTFVLVHWSLRYSRDDILRFFEEEYGGVPKNVVLWI
jgi:ribonuclease Z